VTVVVFEIVTEATELGMAAVPSAAPFPVTVEFGEGFAVMTNAESLVIDAILPRIVPLDVAIPIESPTDNSVVNNGPPVPVTVVEFLLNVIEVPVRVLTHVLTPLHLPVALLETAACDTVDIANTTSAIATTTNSNFFMI
jgi:hypothetical protein